MFSSVATIIASVVLPSPGGPAWSRWSGACPPGARSVQPAAPTARVPGAGRSAPPTSGAAGRSPRRTPPAPRRARRPPCPGPCQGPLPGHGQGRCPGPLPGAVRGPAACSATGQPAQCRPQCIGDRGIGGHRAIGHQLVQHGVDLPGRPAQVDQTGLHRAPARRVRRGSARARTAHRAAGRAGRPARRPAAGRPCVRFPGPSSASPGPRRVRRGGPHPVGAPRAPPVPVAGRPRSRSAADRRLSARRRRRNRTASGSPPA